jgi:integrase
MLYLSERAVDALRVHLGDRRSGLVFDGRGMGWVRSALRRCARAAEVTGRHNAHAWRHAFARRCVRSGLDLSRTARLMGHRSIAVTARYYAVWDGDELAEAYSRVTGM